MCSSCNKSVSMCLKDAAIPTIIQEVDSTHGTVAPPPTLQLQAPFDSTDSTSEAANQKCEKMPGGVGCNICKLDVFS